MVYLQSTSAMVEYKNNLINKSSGLNRNPLQEINVEIIKSVLADNYRD